MKFSEKFTKIYWVIIVVCLFLILITRLKIFFSNHITKLDYYLIIIFSVLLLIPLFSEINIFGLNFKRMIDDAKQDIRQTVFDLKSEMRAYFNIKQNMQQDIHIHTETVNQKEYNKALAS